PGSTRRRALQVRTRTPGANAGGPPIASPTRRPQDGAMRLTRKELLKSGAAALPAALLGPRAFAAQARPATAGMNTILFLTDQERAIQHFPAGWAQRNLPGLMRLKRHGVSFENAFTNACMCSPARSTLMTGRMPAQHGVKYTLEEEMPASAGYPQV